MTSEERREEEERQRQARLARARMLTILDSDEEKNAAEDTEVDPRKAVNGEAKAEVPSSVPTKDGKATGPATVSVPAVQATQATTETKTCGEIKDAAAQGSGTEGKVPPGEVKGGVGENRDAAAKGNGKGSFVAGDGVSVPAPAQVLAPAPITNNNPVPTGPVGLATLTSVAAVSNSPVQFVPESRPSEDEKNKAQTKEPTAAPNSDPGKPAAATPMTDVTSPSVPVPVVVAAKPKKKEPAGGVDSLDAFMASIAGKDDSHLKDVGETDSTVKTTQSEAAGENDVTKARVITLEEMEAMGLLGKPAEKEEKQSDTDDDKYYSDFMKKLREQPRAVEPPRETESMNIDIDASYVKALFQPQSHPKAIEPAGNISDGHPKEIDKGGVRIYNDDDDAYLLELEKDYEDDDFLARQRRQAEKKELKPVNHAEIQYPPFRKLFYIEVPEISRMDDKELKRRRKAMGGIKVRGQDCPKPVMNWYQCGLSDKVLRVIEKKGFKDMFPIQAQAIPAIMGGKDVIAIAETGSGKTLAYVLPMLRHVLDQPLSAEGEGPIAVVMAPTRELATQIHADIKIFTKTLGLRCVCVYGGAGLAGQISELKHGCEIVVCTPGRMIEVLTMSNGRVTNLARVTYVVLDEADRMLDLGFEPQIGKIIANVRPDRQAVMCSATFPKQIENLAKKVLKSPVEIVVGNRGQACRNVEQYVEVREESTKLHRLLEVLGEWSHRGSVLIFVDKHAEADNLFKELFNIGYKTLVLHGGQDQTDREFTISDFKSGVRNILVATSLAARGLDIKNVTLVVNYSCPNHTEDYVHRVGRTGRAGNKGVAITFITPDECKYAGEIMRALKLSGNPIPEDLEELDRVYREKVSKGEMEKYRPNGFVGKGYKFTEDEETKVKQVRKQLSRSFGFDADASDSDSDIEVGKDKKSKQQEEEKSREQVVAERIKDPKIKQAALDAAVNAAKIAIANGSDKDGIMKAAESAINKVIDEYKPSVSLKEGLERVMQLRDDYEAQEDTKNNRVSAEFEINDYPQLAKTRVCDKEFSSRISESTGCNISVRGVNVEMNRNPPMGQRKLYIHIEGPSKQDVQDAHREIKRVLEEAAGQAIEARYNGGGSGRYTVP